MTFTNKLIIQDQIEALEHNISELNNEIESKQKEIDSFEYEMSESEFDDYLDDCYPTVTVAGMVFCASDILKSCDPVVYRCIKSDCESDYELDDLDEYQDLKDELEALEGQLEDLESELEDFQDQLDSLDSE